MSDFVITIARGFGSGGKQIGLALAKDLGIPCYDSQILSLASDYSGIAKQKFVQADEKLLGNSLLKRLKSTQNTDVEISPSDKKFFSENNLFSIQTRIIRELAKKESCIIIGKCANYLLRDFNNVISVYVEAPREACLKNVVEKLGVSEAEAAKLITKTDKYRTEYFRHYTGGRKWTDPVLYDMTLNSDRIGKDKCVELIKAYIVIKLEVALPHGGSL